MGDALPVAACDFRAAATCRSMAGPDEMVADSRVRQLRRLPVSPHHLTKAKAGARRLAGAGKRRFGPVRNRASGARFSVRLMVA